MIQSYVFKTELTDPMHCIFLCPPLPDTPKAGLEALNNVCEGVIQNVQC